MGEEKNFENRVKKWLRDNGCWIVKFFGNGFTQSGIPDLLGCLPNGKMIAIELKSENGIVSELQKYNLTKISDCGGFACVLRPSNYDSFKTKVLQLINNGES